MVILWLLRNLIGETGPIVRIGLDSGVRCSIGATCLLSDYCTTLQTSPLFEPARVGIPQEAFHSIVKWRVMQYHTVQCAAISDSYDESRNAAGPSVQPTQSGIYVCDIIWLRVGGLNWTDLPLGIGIVYYRRASTVPQVNSEEESAYGMALAWLSVWLDGDNLSQVQAVMREGRVRYL
ncbi:hypothetical protein L873DRAFT_1839671 [Choiromyces venosus 120613-1]|uniref:Uncharacterized protein n=1 Tax=Choiromyces venosus 120613-1 TaxID=1336337 RepID=A0A3N4K5C6_9PEZI|nr:hypothetical protein L873DRAFT_1839671 [Choiromyces venosus 120613-1]